LGGGKFGGWGKFHLKEREEAENAPTGRGGRKYSKKNRGGGTKVWNHGGGRVSVVPRSFTN